ncbi:hypothetical protein [Nocardia panacis]|uniref:hypothetical protein n=1 Tax=Nocardia panacis TaxID=2340916 RepID=UPI0011C3F812|nr:hypothetical protein [Nocardia panacis]
MGRAAVGPIGALDTVRASMRRIESLPTKSIGRASDHPRKPSRGRFDAAEQLCDLAFGRGGEVEPAHTGDRFLQGGQLLAIALITVTHIVRAIIRTHVLTIA